MKFQTQEGISNSGPKARPQISLGQRPRTSACKTVQAVGLAQTAMRELFRAFSPKPFWFQDLGRCPTALKLRARPQNYTRSFPGSSPGMPMSWRLQPPVSCLRNRSTGVCFRPRGWGARPAHRQQEAGASGESAFPGWSLGTSTPLGADADCLEEANRQ